MPLTHIKIAKDLQELTLHGSKEFPVALYETTMSMDSMDFLPLHWHKEIQFVYLKSGRAKYRIGTNVLVLEEGRGYSSTPHNYMRRSPFKWSRLLFTV